MLEIEALSKAYGEVRALEDVDLHVPEGDSCLLVGPEGAGKTTLARIIAGLEPPTAGTLRLDGRDLLAEASARTALGYVPAHAGFDEERTPRQVLRSVGRLHGMPTSQLERRIDDLLIALRLEHLGGHATRHLGDGAHRLLALAAALVHDPSFLLVDEPTRGLGPAASRRMRQAIARFGEPRTLLVLTGRPGDVEPISQRIVGLEGGSVFLDARVDEIEAEHGVAVEVHIDGELPISALEDLRGHDALAAIRQDPEDTTADLELWITDPEQAHALLRALIDHGAQVSSFAPRAREIGQLIEEHMEAEL